MIVEKEQERWKEEQKRTSSQPHSGREDYASFRVNWVTQKTQRQNSKDNNIPIQQEKLIDKQHVRQLKLCLRKEINLIPSVQINEGIEHIQQNHQNRVASSNELKQCSSSNSQKNSCEKRAKLSLISKRPSLRKISDFISYKEEAENEANTETIRQASSNVVLKQVVPSNQVQHGNKQTKKGKKCIRISLKRQCLAQINKN